MPYPTELRLNQRHRELDITFDDDSHFTLSCELLRVLSPSAEVRGHGPGQEVLVSGKREVGIQAIEPVGHYAVKLVFDDGHDSGLYTWDYLYDLGHQREAYWQDYLDRLQQAGLDRETQT